MNLILFDDPGLRMNLLPFTYTRPVSKIRVGILTIDEKWERWLGTKASFQTAEYLSIKYPLKNTADNFLVNGAICPDAKLVETIKALPAGKFLVKDQLLLAANQPAGDLSASNTIEYHDNVVCIDRPWKIFTENSKQISSDFALITKGRTSAGIKDKHTITYSVENIFVEEGADIKAAIINAENGPVYIGKNSTIQEGALIRGPFALCEGAHVNMGAKMRGDVTVGPYSKVGGEISASVIFGHSNKAHDGFLGCSVLGEWCNLGADTNTSNLKNNYDIVKLWNHGTNSFESTGQQFCGLMMGDHSKSSINTMFNTGTVVDVAANIFGEGFPRNYVPSFSWGGASGMTTYKLDKAFETAERVMSRRKIELDKVERDILTKVFEMTAYSRVWEKR